MRHLLYAISATLLLSVSALAQGVPQSVSDLINLYKFEVKGVFPSDAGPGILLEGQTKDANGNPKTQLIMCFVAETPGSPTISTQYCKPVE